MTDDELLELLESTANMLRGMTMDPSIPRHVKDALWSRIGQLETAVESRSADSAASPTGGEG